MPEILYFLLPKNTFRLFGTEMMIIEKLQYKIQMLEMLSPCLNIDVDIIKQDHNEVIQVGRIILFINSWNVEGELLRPKGMNKN